MLGGWALEDIPDRRATRVAILLIGGVLCAINVRLMYTASWSNAALCPACAIDSSARRDYLARYGARSVAADYLNANFPKARVGFFMLGASPAGYVGYSRAANWHDYPTFSPSPTRTTARDVLAHARSFGLTHIVYRDPP